MAFGDFPETWSMERERNQWNTGIYAVGTEHMISNRYLAFSKCWSIMIKFLPRKCFTDSKLHALCMLNMSLAGAQQEYVLI